jgi:methionyl-tRNA synthetase
MLMAHEEFIIPTDIPANEFLNIEGQKISTSRNWAVWADDYLDAFPPDPLRYYLEANAPENKDADFTWKDFQARHNGDLADVLGNLINRCLSFVEKNFENRVPPAGALTDADRETLDAIEKAAISIGGALDGFQVRRGVGELMDLARIGNKYFNDAAPWTAMKTDRARAAAILNTTIQLEAALSILMEPFIPHSAGQLRKMLNIPEDSVKHWSGIAGFRLADNHTLGKREILFSKIEDSVIDEQIARLGKQI